MPDRRRVERTPDTLLLLSTCALSAGVLTATGQVPLSILKVAPAWVGLVWSGALALAAATALIGVLYREPLMGWVLELAGRLGLLVGCLGYAVALVGTATAWGSSLIIAIITGIGVSSGWRAWQISRRLESLRSMLRGET